MTLMCICGSILIAVLTFLVGFPLGALVGWAVSKMVMIDPKQVLEVED